MRIKIRRSLKRDLTYHDAKREIFSDEQFLKELGAIASKKKLNGEKLNAEEARLLCNGYLKEIAARYTENRIFWKLCVAAARRNVIGSFKKVYYNKDDIKTIRKLLKSSLVTITPNHRSVFDFIILSYILVKETTFLPIILAADVFNAFPIGYLFRRMGAYFISRSETDEMYSLVFKHYVMLILKYELLHMFFIEGGRNKTGAYSTPKKGILKYILEGAKKYNPKKDLAFLPVNISYDIVPESYIVVEESRTGVRKHIFRSVINYAAKKDLGSCYINFGKPVRLSAFSRSRKFSSEAEIVESLGDFLINRIKSLVIVSPISLISYTLLKANNVKFEDIKFEEFKRSFKMNFERLKRSKKNIAHIDLSKIPKYIDFAHKKGIINFDKKTGVISISSQQKQLIEYYSSNILHLFG